MEFETLWGKFLDGNPDLAGSGNVTLTRAGVREMMRCAYEQGKLAATKDLMKEATGKPIGGGLGGVGKLFDEILKPR